MTKFLLYLSGIKTFLIGGALVAGLATAGVAYGIKAYKQHKAKALVREKKAWYADCTAKAKTNAEYQLCFTRS